MHRLCSVPCPRSSKAEQLFLKLCMWFQDPPRAPKEMKISDIIIIKKRSKFPKCVRKFKELKGICVGTCIDRFHPENWNNVYAHAHSRNDDDPYKGWICLRDKYILKDRYSLLHEVAHLIADKVDPEYRHHSKKWKEILIKIGGTIKVYIDSRGNIHRHW